MRMADVAADRGKYQRILDISAICLNGMRMLTLGIYWIPCTLNMNVKLTAGGIAHRYINTV